MLSRRALFAQSMTGVAVSLLAACAPAPTAPAATSGAKLQLPTYVPVQGPQPDLPGTADGLDPGFVNYPRQLFKSVQDKPTAGGQVNIMVWNITQPMTALDQNAAWQEINNQVGGTIN